MVRRVKKRINLKIGKCRMRKLKAKIMANKLPTKTIMFRAQI